MGGILSLHQRTVLPSAFLPAGASSSTGEVERSDEENENRQVAANVHLAWGRFHLDRLKQARKRHFPEEGGDCKDFSHEVSDQRSLSPFPRDCATQEVMKRVLWCLQRTPEEEITPEILFPMMSIAEVPALLSIDDFETVWGISLHLFLCVVLGGDGGWDIIIFTPMSCFRGLVVLRGCSFHIQARAVFKESLTRLKKALEFYILDGYVTEHIDILEDQSSLYRELSFFETDVDRKWCVFPSFSVAGIGVEIPTCEMSKCNGGYGAVEKRNCVF